MLRLSKRTVAWCVGLVVLTLAGCKSFKEEKNFDIEPGGVKAFGTPATKKPSFEFTSEGGPITVYLCLDKDSEAIQQAALNSKKIDETKIIKKSENKTADTIDHTADSKAEFAFVIVAKGKKATVKATIKG